MAGIATPATALSAIASMRYAASTFGKTVIWSASDVYALFSLSELMGLSGTSAGLVFLALLAVSAGSDACAGWVADQPWAVRRSRALIVGAALVSGAGFALSFSWFALGAGAAAGLAAALLFRVAFSFVDVPHNALMLTLADSPSARAKLATARLYAVASGSLCVGAIALAVIGGRTSGAGIDRLDEFGLIIAILGVLLIAITPVSAWPHQAVMMRADAGSDPGRRRLSDMPALRWAALSLCVILLGAVVFGLAPKLLPYLAARTGDPGWAGRALIILTLGKLIAAPLWPRVLTRLGPASSSAMAYFGASISVLGLLWMGVWPFGVDVALFGFGMSLGGVSVLSWVVLGDIADGIKRHTERAAGATLFGAVACAMKLSNGISGGLLGFAIGSNGQGLAARPLDLLILVMAGGGGLAALLLWRVKEPELITARLGHVTPTPGR